MTIESKYDIIIAGGGLSGLSLAWHLIEGGYTKQMLIADSTFAPINDKTWCFWTNKPPPFKQIIYKKWNKAYTDILDFKGFQYLNEYTYYSIRSGDFREYVLSHLKKRSNVTFLEEDILDFSSNKKKAVLLTKTGDSFLADYIFQSVLPAKELDRSQIKYPLIQHFLGREIKSNKPVFDPDTFTMMHFDESYEKGAAFIYLLPWNQYEALVEYTIFSKETEKKKFYKEKIRQYLQSEFGLDESDYEKGRKEYGKIPMEDRPYHPYYENKVINLGTVGGLTKPSTGYTFMRIQEYSTLLAKAIIANKELPNPTRSKFRYRYYDLLLLHILSTSSEESLKVFKYLFKNNNIDEIFRFLMEDTTLNQDFKIMASVPYTPFLKAIYKNI